MTRIARASLIIAFFFAVDKVLGLLRQVLFNRQFLPAARDVFFVSNNLPDLLSALISGGALGIALIPVLTETLDRDGRQAAWALFTRIVNLAFLATAGIAGVIFVFSTPLVHSVIAPGFTPEQQALTAALMRLDLIAILIFSISGLVMAGLQANQHFLLPALAPILYNGGQILGITVLGPRLGIYGLAYGVILGALLHLGIQIPGLIRYGYRWAPAISLHHPGVRQVLSLMGPRVLSMFCLQSYFVMRDRLASFYTHGGVSALNNGWFIQQVPETLIGTAIAIALLPSLSDYITRGDIEEYQRTINRALRAMLALGIPIAALLSIAIRPLIQFAFHFQPAETELAVWATRAFLLGLVGHTWLEVAVRSFYARQNARLPLLAAALQAITFIILAPILSNAIGHTGIPLADTLTFTGEALLLLWLLNRDYRGVLRVGGTLLRAGLGAAAGAGLGYILLMVLPLPAAFAALGAIAAGGLVALPFIWPEVKSLVRL